jgi:hypothetical protein
VEFAPNADIAHLGPGEQCFLLRERCLAVRDQRLQLVRCVSRAGEWDPSAACSVGRGVAPCEQRPLLPE